MPFFKSFQQKIKFVSEKKENHLFEFQLKYNFKIYFNEELFHFSEFFFLKTKKKRLYLK